MCTLCQSLNPSLELTVHNVGEGPSVSSFEASGTAYNAAAQNAVLVEMADAADGPTTAYTINDGDVFSGSLSSTDGADWIQIDLAAGELLHVEGISSIGGSALGLNIYDASGTLLQTDSYFDSDQSFNVFYNEGSVAQTFYIGAVNYTSSSLDYTLEVNTTEYQEGTYDQIAEGLTKSWLGVQMSYDIPVSGTVYYNHENLTSDGQFLAEAALEAWTAVSGISFEFDATVLTDSDTGLFFDDNESGAFAGPSSIGENGVINGSSINVGTGWLNTYGTTLDSYSFLTYIHEIGHAMGLDHSGPYNGFATYSSVPGGDNVWSNDSYQSTVMSYFGLDAISGQGTDDWLPVTPMISDIKAFQLLYGTAGDIRTGDTVYGENSTAGGYYDDLENLTGPLAFTIIDDGGEDTINFGSTTSENVIDLTPGASSDIGGLTNNMTIFDTTIIENVIGGSNRDEIFGNDVANSISGGSGNDTVYGGEGSDTLYGGADNDELHGETGKDRLFDGAGNDTVFGGDGNDYMRVGGGVDVFDGGEGTDYISYYDSTNGITANLDTNTISGSWAVNDTINSFEGISGSRTGDDDITGTSGANTIRTYGGDDRVYAGKGTDKVELGSGNDYVRVGGGAESFDGGSGKDYISYYDSSNGIRIDLEADTVSGSWAVNDTIKNFESASGSGTGNDVMLGTSGSNTLKGFGGDDKLYGRSGDDKLYGGSGNDRFDGGAGTDRLWGGSGADTFHFDYGEDHDVIEDFENNVDVIQLDNFTFAPGTDAFDFAEQVGNDVVFEFDNGDGLTVLNVTVGQLVNDLEMV